MNSDDPMPINQEEFYAVIESLVTGSGVPAEAESELESPAAVVDMNALLIRVEGDKDLLAQMAELFLEECPQSLCTIREADRKSTRLNSSHVRISYAVFCLKKKLQSPAYHKRKPQRSDEHESG